MELSIFKKQNIEGKKGFLTVEQARIALLAFFGLFSGLIYWFVYRNQVFLYHYYLRSRMDVNWLYEGGTGRLAMFLSGFALLGLFYYLSYRLAKVVKPIYAWIITIAGTLFFSVTLLFIYPFDSSDLFDNIVHGRMIAFHGMNPFFRTAMVLWKTDPFVRYMGWPRALSAYGPVWELLAGATAKLAGSGIYQNIIAFKLLPGLFFFATLGLIAAILIKRSPQTAPANVLLLAWNPVVLYEIFGNGHNDVVMLFWIVAAAWAIYRRHYTLAILALVMGTLFKYIPLLLIPAAGLIALRELPNWWSRIRFTLITGVLSVAMIVAAYAPFWYGIDTLTIDRRTKLYTSSLPASIYHVLIPKLGQDSASQAVSRVALGLTLVVALYIGYKAFRDRSPESFERASFKTLAFYLLVTCLWFFQWYTLWLLCLIPLLPAGSSFRKLAVVFGFTAISKQFFIGPILFWGSTNFVQPKLEIIFTLGTLGPTWLYALFLLGRDSRLLQALWAKIRRQKLELAYVPVTNEDPLDHYHGNGMD